jgi:hypothetical protein
MLRAAGLLAAAVWALVAGAAHAVEFTTTWVGTDSTQQIRCRVVNVGTKPVKVLAEVVDDTGANLAVLTFPGCNGVDPLPPNGRCSAVSDGGAAGYCRFTSSSKRIRGALTLEQTTGSAILQTIPATR